MAVTVKRATLWTIQTSNASGSLASTLSPLAHKGVNLDLVMGYSHPNKRAATIEVYPVDSPAAQRAARSSGFAKSAFPCVCVSGPNRVGLGRQIAAALADGGININFFVGQVIGKHYTGMFSFEADSEADLAVRIIRQAVKKSPAANGRSRTGAIRKSVGKGPARKKKTAVRSAVAKRMPAAKKRTASGKRKTSVSKARSKSTRRKR